MSPKRYRKKPVEVEAMQWDGGLASAEALCRWANDGADEPVLSYLTAATEEHPFDFQVETLEGPLCVSQGDWIIRGVAGEFYPCKPDIFAATYEVVEA